jgi:hypothetical protein
MLWNGWVSKNAQFFNIAVLFDKRDELSNRKKMFKLKQKFPEQAEAEEQSWRKWVQRTKWIKYALRGMDFLILLGSFLLAYYVHIDPGVSLVLGLLSMLLNHLFTPIAVEQVQNVISPPSNIKVGMNLVLLKKINRHADEK